MSGRRNILWGSAIAVAGVAAAPAHTEPLPVSEAEIARCIRQSSSGRQWLAVTLWGLRDQEGGWAGASTRNANGSSDLGPLQINSWWISRLAAWTGGSHAEVRHWLTNDVCFNIDAGRWIFLTGLAAKGDYWAAVGAYHNPDTERARRYARSVALKIQARFGPGVFVMPRSQRRLLPHEVTR